MKKYKNIIIIILINIFIILLTTKTNYFASTMDYLNQHAVFPEYLRQTFYETKKLIPSLAINLGGGQNIYNIAYYGLLNPIILFSYFLPFIKMIDYLIITNIILLISSEILLYKFLKNKFSEKMCLFLTIIFALSSPLIFHFHRQYMFVNYMPFLILSLISIDQNNKIKLTINIFLIIMTSFYYSVPSILVILIYYIYKEEKLRIKNLFQILLIILIAILSSAILTIPTLKAIMETRSNPSQTNILNLLMPRINPDNLLYSSYSTGLTAIIIIALISLLIKKNKKQTKLAAIILIIISEPIFIYLLNGGLYQRPKILIPFLPILILIIGIFLKDLFDDKINIKKLITITIIVNLVTALIYHNYLYYIDTLFEILLIFFYKKLKNKYIIAIPLISLSLIICINTNLNENYITKEQYKNLNDQEIKIDTNYRTININDKSNNVNKTSNLTTSIYSSTINKYYSKLYHNIFKINNSEINNLSLPTTTNILFNKYMGVKYIISNENLSYPYKKISKTLYELETLPIGYATINTVNRKYYENLKYPYNLDILLNYIIDDKSTNEPQSKIEKINLEYEYELGENIELKNQKLYVQKNSNIKIKLKENLSNKILFIDINNQQPQSQDITLTINNEKNLLTKINWPYPNNNTNFHYCLNNVVDTLDIEISKGIYDISDIKTYTLEKTFEIFDIDPFIIEKINTEIIEGSINASQDETFILKIPYDKGFDIKVDNQKIKYNLVNESFIGFKINKGSHKIQIKYTPSYQSLAKILTFIGLTLFIIRSIYDKKNNISNNNHNNDSTGLYDDNKNKTNQ